MVWFRRVPIATHYLKREFEQPRGHRQLPPRSRRPAQPGGQQSRHRRSEASRSRRQAMPIIETRLKWNGNFEVYRIVARGVRLRGGWCTARSAGGRSTSCLPPPSATSRSRCPISCSTLPTAASRWRRHSGRSESRSKATASSVAASTAGSRSPARSWSLGRCGGDQPSRGLGVAVVARHPQVQGPLALDRFACPASRFDIAAPRFDAKASFNEAFTSIDGSGRMAIATLVAGVERPGQLCSATSATRGRSTTWPAEVKLSAQQSRLATDYRPSHRASKAHITSALSDGHVQPGGELCRATNAALVAEHARRRHAAARRQRQDADRSGGASHRQRAAPARRAISTPRGRSGS